MKNQKIQAKNLKKIGKTRFCPFLQQTTTLVVQVHFVMTHLIFRLAKISWQQGWPLPIGLSTETDSLTFLAVVVQ